jgi:hypothetical protein
MGRGLQCPSFRAPLAAGTGFRSSKLAIGGTTGCSQIARVGDRASVDETTALATIITGSTHVFSC